MEIGDKILTLGGPRLCAQAAWLLALDTGVFGWRGLSQVGGFTYMEDEIEGMLTYI